MTTAATTQATAATFPTSSARRTLVFHPLTVAAVAHETPDSVVITFDVPPDLASTFRFTPGQHVTIRRAGDDGSGVRRSYSLCGVPDGPLRIGVRRIDGGRLSTWLADELAPGDRVEVLPPLGGFVLSPPTGARRRLSFVAAGSGITPVLAMVASVLDEDAHAEVAVLVLNRTIADAMFVEDLQALKNRYLGHLQLIFCCTREQRETDPLGRRPTRADLRGLRDHGLLPDADDWYLCGPAGLLDDLEAVLGETGVDPGRVHRELFSTGRRPARAEAPGRSTAGGGTRAIVTFLGRSTTVPVPRGATLLDAARTLRSDLPYSCEAGVCSTCRALVRSGEVDSPDCPGLTREESGANFVLTCQARAVSDGVELDFDV